MESVTTIVRGIKAWFETGDMKNFFIHPASYVRLCKIQDVMRAGPLTVVDLLSYISRANACIYEIEQYGEHEQFLIPLTNRISGWTRELTNKDKRDVPFVFWLFGRPGTGKTTGVSYITKLHEKHMSEKLGEPFKHSTLYGDLFQKYPFETAINDGYTAIVLNDIPGDYTQDIKNGKIDGMCYFQRAKVS